MTSLRQVESNRHNASKSTGPATGTGKGRSSRNAVRHGVCAETVVAAVEDMDDYQAFEAAVMADYDVKTAVERELVLRLASLLWRLRRATAIETGIFEINAKRGPSNDDVFDRSLGPDKSDLGAIPTRSVLLKHEISVCFLRFSGFDGAAFDRVSRYETALWRQLRQTLFALQLLSRQEDTTLRAREKNAYRRGFLSRQ